MLDRLISGAGAVTDRADRSVRLLAGGSNRGWLGGLPGSLWVAVLLVVALPDPAATLAPGAGIATRVSGRLRTPTGLEHVRETPARLVRFVSTHAATGDPLTTTLIVERDGQRHGIGLGLGEVSALCAGRVMTLGAPRPALRVVAGTGPLLLSFENAAERDQAAAELLTETGLGPDGGPRRTT